MRRFLALVGAVLVGYALLPSLAQAQVYVVPARVYVAPPPVVVVPQSTYYAPPPPITTTQYSYYPPTVVPQATTITYAAPPVVTYSAPPVVTYSPAIVVPATRVETTTTYGIGIFRPRGWTTTTTYR